jgi:general secretion pathway protein G
MDNKGFSLIELLIVILILAVITGIAIPSYWLITARTRESATESEMLNIAKALEIHNSEKLAYPLTGEYPEALEDNDYMQNVPLVDAWENNYNYDSDGSGYTLSSGGMDGVSGNSDDIVVADGAITEDGAYNN